MKTEIRKKIDLETFQNLFKRKDLLNIDNFIQNGPNSEKERKPIFNIIVIHKLEERPDHLLERALFILKLENNLEKLETRLLNEKLRIHNMLKNRGFGYAMRNVKIGYSDAKENALQKQVDNLREKINLLNNNSN